jgi:hypothetical protein
VDWEGPAGTAEEKKDVLKIYYKSTNTKGFGIL